MDFGSLDQIWINLDIGNRFLNRSGAMGRIRPLRPSSLSESGPLDPGQHSVKAWFAQPTTIWASPRGSTRCTWCGAGGDEAPVAARWAHQLDELPRATALTCVKVERVVACHVRMEQRRRRVGLTGAPTHSSDDRCGGGHGVLRRDPECVGGS
jgi:hypothetical protein